MTYPINQLKPVNMFHTNKIKKNSTKNGRKKVFG